MNFFAPILEPVFRIIDKIIPDAKQAAEAKQTLFNSVQQGQTQELQELAKVVVAEAQGSSWLQRNWRPLIMMEFGAIIFNNYIFSPLLVGFGLKMVTLPIPPEMWTLMDLGLSGYIVSRGVEKTVKYLKNSTANLTDTHIENIAERVGKYLKGFKPQS